MLLIDELLFQIALCRNMHKNEFFLLKNCKNRPALEALPQDLPANPPLRIPGYAAGLTHNTFADNKKMFISNRKSSNKIAMCITQRKSEVIVVKSANEH